jgi:hypothetical protein
MRNALGICLDLLNLAQKKTDNLSALRILDHEKCKLAKRED